MLDGQKSETSSVIIKVCKIRCRNEVVDTFVCFQDVGCISELTDETALIGQPGSSLRAAADLRGRPLFGSLSRLLAIIKALHSLHSLPSVGFAVAM